MYTWNRYKRIRARYTRWSNTIYQWDICFIARPKAQIYLIVYWRTSTITTSKTTQPSPREGDSWDALREANKYHQMKYQMEESKFARSSLLHMWVYWRKDMQFNCKVDIFGIRWIIRMIFIFPKICSHLNILIFAIKWFHWKALQDHNNFKQHFMPKITPWLDTR